MSLVLEPETKKKGPQLAALEHSVILPSDEKDDNTGYPAGNHLQFEVFNTDMWRPTPLSYS